MNPFVRTGRELGRVLRAETVTHQHLRDRLLAAFWITLAVDIAGSIAIFYTERHANGSEIHTVGSAFFWVSGQLLTVSSQLKNPITPAARAIDIFLEIYAITVVTTLAGMFGAFFHRRSEERRQASSD